MLYLEPQFNSSQNKLNTGISIPYGSDYSSRCLAFFTESQMKTIELTQGQTAIIDDGEFAKISKHRWFAFYNGRTFYAMRNRSKKSIKSGRMPMANQIMDCPSGFEVDHKNHNTLDNQRCNLRICTHQQNMQSNPPIGGTSKYKGVSWNKCHKKWRARVKMNGKEYFLGYFDNEIDAARAYDNRVRILQKDFAWTNNKHFIEI